MDKIVVLRHISTNFDTFRHISTSSMEQLNGTAQWNSSIGAVQGKIG